MTTRSHCLSFTKQALINLCSPLENKQVITQVCTYIHMICLLVTLVLGFTSDLIMSNNKNIRVITTHYLIFKPDEFQPLGFSITFLHNVYVYESFPKGTNDHSHEVNLKYV